MAAFNIVRMRVKPGREADFLDLHREMDRSTSGGMSGMRRALIVKTGERSYCLIGEWDSFDSIVSARAEMVGSLDRMRDLLEDLGAGLGVTDPVSGEVVLELGVPPARRARSSPGKTAKGRGAAKSRGQGKKPVGKTSRASKGSAAKSGTTRKAATASKPRKSATKKRR